MSIPPSVRINRNLVVKGRTILTDLPDNVFATSGSTSSPFEGIFLGAVFDGDKCRHVVSLGNFRDLRFLAWFRIKFAWMSQKTGNRGSDIPPETQFLMVESKDESNMESDEIVYTFFLPLIEGPFRACLQGNSKDEFELCLESGDDETTLSKFTHSVYIRSGTDPFNTITEAIKVVKDHLKTFRLRYEKKLPQIVDYFGWCTWDAFYRDVTQKGIESGLVSLSAGGAPPKFVIIDDGWQSISCESESPSLLTLRGIKKNDKFQNEENPTGGLKNIVAMAKEKYGVKYMYMWHTITEYWGWVDPAVMKHYPELMDCPLGDEGLELVDPRNLYKFYGKVHTYLSGAGVDGVKMDWQCVLELLGAGFGGRVELTRQYHQALDESVSRNFPDNGCIACMSHNTDSLYCSRQTAVVRASDNFLPHDPVPYTFQIAASAYNSVFLGEFMQPDWDMFQSLHPAAEYHASARAISGGPVYVSDVPGKHNFDILKKLVLPDGSILRARLPGRPTQDCLLLDPTCDGVSLLKIWNMNKYTGVLGVYNCQCAALKNNESNNTVRQAPSKATTGFIRARDIHLISDATMDSDWNDDCAVYCHEKSNLIILPRNAGMPLSLKVLEHEIFTMTPIKVLAPGFSFAPLGLIDMYNAGGAIEGLTYKVKGGSEFSELEDWYRREGNQLFGNRIENLTVEIVAMVRMEVKGCGRFGAYSSAKPRKCSVGSTWVKFKYNSVSGLVSFNLDYLPEEDRKFRIVVVLL